MNIHLAVGSQVANQERVNEIQKVTLSPWHRCLKGLGKYNNNFMLKMLVFVIFLEGSEWKRIKEYIQQAVQLKKKKILKLFLTSSEIVFN